MTDKHECINHWKFKNCLVMPQVFEGLKTTSDTCHHVPF